jgi:hypothetical protein
MSKSRKNLLLCSVMMALDLCNDEGLTKESLRVGAQVLRDRDPDLARILERLGVPPLWTRRPGTRLSPAMLELMDILPSQQRHLFTI